MIRTANLKDIFNISEIEKEAFKDPLSEDFFYQEFSSNPFAKYYVYELNHKIVGYIGYRVVDHQAEMMNFAVLKDYQKENIGQTILYETLDILKKESVKTVILEVRRSNKIAQHIYEKFGFIKSHIKKKYYINEDAFVYIKEV